MNPKEINKYCYYGLISIVLALVKVEGQKKRISYYLIVIKTCSITAKSINKKDSKNGKCEEYAQKMLASSK